MAEPNRPQSPFAASIDFSARSPLRALAPEEIEQILAAHCLYLEAERRVGRRALDTVLLAWDTDFLVGGDRRWSNRAYEATSQPARTNLRPMAVARQRLSSAL